MMERCLSGRWSAWRFRTSSRRGQIFVGGGSTTRRSTWFFFALFLMLHTHHSITHPEPTFLTANSPSPVPSSSRFLGDTCTVTVLREGNVMNRTVSLSAPRYLVPECVYDTPPRYCPYLPLCSHPHFHPSHPASFSLPQMDTFF